MRYEIVLFDADNTLLDFNKAEKYALTETFNHLSVPCPESVTERYSAINGELWNALERGEIDRLSLQTLRFERLSEEIGCILNPEKTNKLYLHNLSKQAHLMEGAIEILEKLRPCCTLYIVTNGTKKAQNMRVRKSGIEKYFKKRFISEDVGYSKPDKRFFDYVFKNARITDKSKVLIVGDSLAGDIVGGKNAEISTCWYNPNAWLNNTKIIPDYEIMQFSELFDIIGIGQQ
ncbi:MAG: YjjG family noncanonical pyrimidine nucleotidase [Oscillospiraceae bacterium]|nr:YjjG family noncanonical pyrimidine nucleotidase [Oscillospiraceae bacterium]